MQGFDDILNTDHKLILAWKFRRNPKSSVWFIILRKQTGQVLRINTHAPWGECFDPRTIDQSLSTGVSQSRRWPHPEI
jgi:hypothetical protein